MAKLTLGELRTGMSLIGASLDVLIGKLQECDQDEDLKMPPGKGPICNIPIIAGADCLTSKENILDVRAVTEAVTSIRAWMADVSTALESYDGETSLDAAEWSARGDASQA